LDLNSLSSNLLDNIQLLINTNQQKYDVKNCSLRFMIKDRDENLLVDLPSKNIKVNPSDDLLAEIFSLTNVQPVLN
jgi:DNA polymerase-3 subunit alpha